ncbi:MAG: polyprenyl synthetase family protein [Hyphomicrobiales bacterium]
MTSSTQSSFKDRLSQVASIVEADLNDLLTFTPPAGIGWPDRLFDAMRYASLNGGKRVRPFLVIETARLFGLESVGVRRAAVALECIHCYSLVHDDLPAMDDDDLRRGVPTTHKKFDEATAILAGDGLLTQAFVILASSETHVDPVIQAELVACLATAAGPIGMVGGQMLDIDAEHNEKNEKEVRTLQAMKTGALLRVGIEMGAIIAGVSKEDRARLVRFGEVIGLTFQLADDLLDATADAETMGKATGKDAEQGKATLLSIHGIGGVRRLLDEQVSEAEQLLAPFGDKGETLREMARFIAHRAN